MTPRIITKVTGHATSVDQAADLRYLSEIESHGRWGFKPLDDEAIAALIGKPRCIFIAEPGRTYERLPAELLSNHQSTGVISEAYAALLRSLLAEGKLVAQRVVLGPMELTNGHGYRIGHERGSVVPLTFKARMQAQELGWHEALPAAAGRRILSGMMRESIRANHLSRRAVKSMTSTKKAGRTIAAHNLVIAPPLQLLERIRAEELCVDDVLAVAARRAVEQMERKIGAKIMAVAATHLQDSTRVRPHLHVRMSAYDSLGRYIKLFDRKGGGSAAGAAGGGGGRCILQAEVERQVSRIIERWEPRSRKD